MEDTAKNQHELSIMTKDGHVVRNDVSQNIVSSHVCLLIHGLTGTRHEHGLFDDLKISLEAQNMNVVRIALRGHDGSAIPLYQSSLAGMVTDVHRTLEILATTYKTIDIVGISLGGGIANILADIMKPRRLVLLNPVTSFRAVIAQAMTTQHKLAPVDMHRLSSRFVLEILTRGMNQANTSGIPTLLLHATDDPIVPIRASRLYASKRPHVTLEEIPSDDHLLQIHRAHVIEKSTTWLTERGGWLRSTATTA